MAVKEIHKYILENPSLKGVEFTKISRSNLFYPKAVQFATKLNGAILQSAREVGAYEIEANEMKNDTSHYFQRATRTVDIGIKSNGKFYHAIDDTVNPEQNIVIARAEEDFKSHLETDKYLLPVNDTLVKGALLRAEKNGRIVKALAETETGLELKTKAVKGKSKFGQNDWNKAVLLDVAEPYAQMLNQRSYDIGCVWSLTPENLEEMGVDGNFVEVRPVGLFANEVSCFYYIYECNDTTYVGRARGVRGAKEFFPGKEDKVVSLDKKVYALIKKMYA